MRPAHPVILDNLTLESALSRRQPAQSTRSFLAVEYRALGACYLLLGQADKAADRFRKARAANPRYWWVHLWLAGTLGLKRDLDEARSALAESIRRKPEVNSIARWRAESPCCTNPQFTALAEKTLYTGLRRAGLPDE